VRAVILAAGRGHRLRDLTGDRPKCLARIGGCSLLERQIRSLGACGIEAIAVVAGFRAADIRHACGPEVELVVNPEYESTNSLYSLWLARHLLTDGFVVLNGDVLFHDQLLWDLLSSRDEDALLMAATRGAVYSDEEMKIRVRAGCVAGIAKTLDPAEIDGENIGIAKFGVEGAKVLVEEIGQVLAAGGVDEWLPRAFAAFALRRPLHVVETRGYPWTEIDVPEDYWRACAEVLPAIVNLVASAAGPRGRMARAAPKRAGRLPRHV
jgi:choline kinase